MELIVDKLNKKDKPAQKSASPDSHQALSIVGAVDFLRVVLHRRLKNNFSKDPSAAFEMPDLRVESCLDEFNRLVNKFELNTDEYVILVLALVPHFQPNFLDSIVQQYLPHGGDFPEIGGVKVNNHRGTLPTGETAQFILAGIDITNRLRVAEYFSPDHFFYKENILSLETVKDGEPTMSGRIIMTDEYVELLTTGKVIPPVFSQEFPAKRLETPMTWDDLVLHPTTLASIRDIKMWLHHHKTLAKDPVLARKIKKGYRVLFYGPSGTGKTLTGSLLGKEFDKVVYRIDLSQVVSKFIGETEKNLEKIFSKAENKDWILFFDEADALFGKRSGISSAHDKYANQEVSYLLQRVEDYSGLIILASNFKKNIDQAFLRRFNAIIHFPIPDATERLSLWQKNIPQSIPLQADVSLAVYANKYEFTGSAIANIVQYASLCALARQDQNILNVDIAAGIKRELLKDDKIVS